MEIGGRRRRGGALGHDSQVHAHDHGDRLRADRRVLAAALALIVCFTVVEVVAGLLAGSLALLADAGHMLTDAVALGAALFAAWMASRPARGRWTFGFRRVEILAAQANGVLLALLGLGIVYAAIRRLVSPREVEGEVVLGVGLAGIAVSLAATAILAGGSRESLNVRGAFLHVAADVAAFAGTSVAGLLILLTGWDRFDPLAGLAVAALIFWAAFGLIRDSARIFLEAAPGDIDPDAVGRALASEPHVVEVHDLHVWTVTSGFPALSAHVLVEPSVDCHAVRRSLERVLADNFGLTHTTLQVEHAEDSPRRVALGRAFRRKAPLRHR
jgi:cobalt-zinc-cadmium efflux system protein